MRIEFDGVREESVNNFHGGKGCLVLQKTTKNNVSFIKAKLTPGSSVGMHKHMVDSETIYVLSGKGKTICDGETEMLQAGSVTFCPVGCSHCLMNDGTEDLVFFAVIPKQI